MMAKMLLRIGLRLFTLSLYAKSSKKLTPSKKGARYAYLQCKESNPIAIFDNAIDKDCMEWDGRIYKSIGYTIQASDTDEIVEEAFEYIVKESFRFLVDNFMMAPTSIVAIYLLDDIDLGDGCWRLNVLVTDLRC